MQKCGIILIRGAESVLARHVNDIFLWGIKSPTRLVIFYGHSGCPDELLKEIGIQPVAGSQAGKWRGFDCGLRDVENRNELEANQLDDFVPLSFFFKEIFIRVRVRGDIHFFFKEDGTKYLGPMMPLFYAPRIPVLILHCRTLLEGDKSGV